MQTILKNISTGLCHSSWSRLVLLRVRSAASRPSCVRVCVPQSNAEELRAERLRKASERLRSPVVFNKDSTVRKTQLKSFSQYVETRPGKRHTHTHTFSLA